MYQLNTLYILNLRNVMCQVYVNRSLGKQKQK